MGEDFDLFFTPTGNELPPLLDHIKLMEDRLGKKCIIPPGGGTLDYWMRSFNALPNWRQRWCTRLIKIVPCIDYLKKNPGRTLLVGLRADEEERQGLYGDFADYRYPLREWGWGMDEVVGYLKERGVKVPARTDCALCYGQRLSEWFHLWRDYPEEYAKGEKYEADTDHTFRSPGRDTWPAALVELRQAFESGRTPRGVSLNVIDDENNTPACRVCRF